MIIFKFISITLSIFLINSCSGSDTHFGIKPLATGVGSIHYSNKKTEAVDTLIRKIQAAQSPDTPYLGDNVIFFDPTLDRALMQETLDALSRQQASDQFGENRYALLFKPGVYDLRITVDYYMQVAGLGYVPSDVTINGAVQSITTTENDNVTLMFWRSAENMRVSAKEMHYWAVSQAAPFRRMHVLGDIRFDRNGWASGGFLADSKIEGEAGTTSGQQWFSRNCEIGSWRGGHWNMLFAGVKNAPKDPWNKRPYTVIDSTPIVREKPFLTLGTNAELSLFVPDIQKNSHGVSWDKGTEKGKQIPISDFYIAYPEKESAESINRALRDGKHILLTPGIYKLNEPIHITNPHTVIYGLGMPTLIPQKGASALVTSDVDGLIIAGLIIDAGPQHSPTLVEIGEKGSTKPHGAYPTTIHDLYCRVGGATEGSADICITLNSSNVIADHLWLWRADHGTGARWNSNKSKHGIVVNGNDVTLYGLFNEHFQEYQTLWNGERGATYFYQSELPYDPPSQDAWNCDSTKGFASYKVAEHVTHHTAFGLGIYSFFGVHVNKDLGIRLESSIEAPDVSGVSLYHMVNFAAGFGGINHIINNKGARTDVGTTNWYESFIGGEHK